MCILSIDGVIEYPSPSVERMLGHKPKEVIGKLAFDLVHPDDREPVIKRFKERFTGNSALAPLEIRLLHKNGSWLPFEAVRNPVYDAGRISGVLISCRDLSDRKHSESEIKLSEERYRQLFQRNLAGVFVSTPAGSCWIATIHSRIYSDSNRVKRSSRPPHAASILERQTAQNSSTAFAPPK